MLLPYLMVSGSEVLFVILITIFGSEILKILGFGMRFWLFLVFSIIITGAHYYTIRFNCAVIVIYFFPVTHAFLWIQSLRLLKHMENSIKRRKEENRIYDKMRKSVLENIWISQSFPFLHLLWYFLNYCNCIISKKVK